MNGQAATKNISDTNPASSRSGAIRIKAAVSAHSLSFFFTTIRLEMPDARHRTLKIRGSLAARRAHGVTYRLTRHRNNTVERPARRRPPSFEPQPSQARLKARLAGAGRTCARNSRTCGAGAKATTGACPTGAGWRVRCRRSRSAYTPADATAATTPGVDSASPSYI